MKSKSRQRGIASVEAAIILLPLTLMLFGVAEIGNAILQSISVIEASREAARMVVQQGSTVGLQQRLVDLVEPRLLADSLTATVAYGLDASNGQTVTVEVAYEYHPLLAGNPLSEKLLGIDFTIRSATTMPIP